MGEQRLVTPTPGGRMVVTVGSVAVVDGRGQPVTVEARVASGVASEFVVVGYRMNAGRELRDRLRAAMIASGLEWPHAVVAVTVSPSLRGSRSGSPLDLPIAMALLAADGQIPSAHVTGRAFVGELGLDGSIRPVERIRELVSALRRADVVVPVKSLPGARAAATVVGDVAVAASYKLNTLVAALDVQRSARPLRPRPQGPIQGTPPGRAGARYRSGADGTVFESLGDGRYAVVDGPHMVPSQLPLGTVVNAGARPETWSPVRDALAGRSSRDRVPEHVPVPGANLYLRLPYLRPTGDDPPPPGWAVEPAGRWEDRDTEVVYDPRRHDVAFTWQTESTETVSVLEATGWERRAVDGPRTLWSRDRLLATRAALDRHDRAAIVRAEVARQDEPMVPPTGAAEPRGL